MRASRADTASSVRADVATVKAQEMQGLRREAGLKQKK